MRLTGMLAGLRLNLPAAANCKVTNLEGDGDLSRSFEAVRQYPRWSKSVLVGAINDPQCSRRSARLRRSWPKPQLRGYGPKCLSRSRAEMRQKHTQTIGSVAYFPERYGPELIRLSLDILSQRPVPSAYLWNTNSSSLAQAVRLI
jgi:ribose transport system substrate-binding protein